MDSICFQALKPKYPLYDAINIHIKGYDFTLCESYQSFLNKLADQMEIDVVDRWVVSVESLENVSTITVPSFSWAVPPQNMKIQRMKPMSSIIDAEYKLNIYERVIQVRLVLNLLINQNLNKIVFQLAEVPAPLYPQFVRVAQSALPEGVTFEVTLNTEQQEEVRYVPDKEMLDLKDELELLGGAVVRGKGKKKR